MIAGGAGFFFLALLPGGAVELPGRSRPAPGVADRRWGGPACTISLTHSRARGADDGGRRRRDASYGVARDSHRRKQGDRLTQPPYQPFAQESHSNERLRVSNWIVQQLCYYAVK